MLAVSRFLTFMLPLPQDDQGSHGRRVKDLHAAWLASDWELIPQEGTTWPTPPTPPVVLAEHIAAVNAFGEDAIGAHLPPTDWSTTCTGISEGSRPSAAGRPGNWSATGSPSR